MKLCFYLPSQISVLFFYIFFSYSLRCFLVETSTFLNDNSLSPIQLAESFLEEKYNSYNGIRGKTTANTSYESNCCAAPPIAHVGGRFLRRRRRIRYLQQDFAAQAAHGSGSSATPTHPSTLDHFTRLLLESETFVDKSLLIRDILTHAFQIISISTPKRSGKSVNMVMVQKFLELEVDRAGKPLSKGRRKNHKLFFGGEITLEGETEPLFLPKLQISQYRNLFRFHGKFPVVLLNFSDITGTTYEQFEAGLVRQIDKAINQHAYLKRYYERVNESADEALRSQKLDVDRLYTYESVAEPTIYEHLKILISVLAEHFGRKVYVLIDEYDKPVLNAYCNVATKHEEFSKIATVLDTVLLSFLKGNGKIRRAILFGTLPSTLGNARTYKNVFRFSSLDGKFGQYFGYTQPELDELLTRFPTSLPPGAVTEWFSGYNRGERVVYNMYSITRCLLSGGEIQPYWSESGGGGDSLFDTISDTDDVRSRMWNLVKGGSVITPLSRQITPENLWATNMLYEKLVFDGYLNAVRANHSACWWPQYHITVPNHEIRKIFNKKYMDDDGFSSFRRRFRQLKWNIKNWIYKLDD